jgi:hypothetical protein
VKLNRLREKNRQERGIYSEDISNSNNPQYIRNKSGNSGETAGWNYDEIFGKGNFFISTK